MASVVAPSPRAGTLRSGARVLGVGRPTLRFLTQVVAWMVILGLLAMITVIVVIPRIVSAAPYTILTGSMRPTLPPGTLVVARPVDPTSIGIGTVITYQIESGKPEVVTHRVVAISWDRSGNPVWRTQGDANGAVDEGWIRPVQVKGALWYSVPYLGRANLLLGNGQRRVLSYLVAGLLLLYAVNTWAGAYRHRRHLRFRRVES